jgi:O-antigen/teichoic acid export membrane protein
MMTGQVIVKALGIFWLAVLARHLGDERFGYLMYAFSLAGLVGILVEFGFSSVITRAVARRPEEAGRYLSHVLSLRLALSSVSIPLTVLVSLRTGASGWTLAPVWIAAASTAVSGLYAIANAVFLGRERMEMPSLIMVGSKVLSIACGLWAVRSGAGIEVIALALLLEPVLCLLVSVPVLLRGFRLAWVPALDRRFVGGLIREAIPFGLALAVSLAYFKIDVVMLSALKGSRCVGWYSAGFRLLEGLIYVPTAFVNTVFPTFARLKDEPGDRFRSMVSGSWDFVVALAIPIGLVLALNAKTVVLLLYGEEYMETVRVLHLIGPALLFVFLNGFLAVLLGAIDRQMSCVFCSLAGVVLNVLLNATLIPRFAHVGAAWATLVTQAVVAALFAALAVKYSGVRPDGGRMLRLAASAAVLAMVLLALRDRNLIAIFLAAAVIYPAALLATGAVTAEERRRFANAIRRRREGV